MTATDDPPARALVLTAVGYLLTGLLALVLAAAGSGAPLIYPAAGVALACVVVFGPKVLPAVALGSFCVCLMRFAAAGSTGPALVSLSAAIAAAAMLQAWVGAALVRRWVRAPLILAEPLDVVGFFSGGAASCLLGAFLTTATLAAAGIISPGTAPHNAVNWWLADLLGVLIAAPVTLTWIGLPKADWAPRRLSVGVSLLLTLLLLAAGIRQVARWSDERVLAAFDRDASNAVFVLDAQLQEPLRALEAMRGVFLSPNNVSSYEMQFAAQDWLASGTLQAVGWIEPVAADAVADFEARQSAAGQPEFHVFNRTDTPTSKFVAATPTETKMVLRFIDPIPTNSAALGLNVLSVPVARGAVEAAIAGGRPQATAAFRMTQAAPGDPSLSVVLYRAVYRGLADTPAQRRASLHGLVFVTLRMDTQHARAMRQIAPYLQLCVLDTDPLTANPRVAGAPGCERMQAGASIPPPATESESAVSGGKVRTTLTAAPVLSHLRSLPFAGRSWDLRVLAERSHVPGANGTDATLFALACLLATALLSGFLLTVTGRAHRIEAAVRERTAALESEVREREVAEAALRESEQRVRTILDNVPIGMVISDLEGNVIQANASMSQLTGYSEEELLQMRSADYTHPDDVAEEALLREQLVREEAPRYRQNQRFIDKGGTTVSVQATMTLLRDRAGLPRHVIAVVEDITEHMRLAEAENAREVAESSNRAKSEFLSRMSHELRTPLNAVLGFAQLLDLDQRQPLTDAQRPWVQQIQQAGWHLLEMINDVLDLSRIDSGNVRLQLRRLNLADVVTASMAMVEGAARQRGIVITRQLGEGATVALGDATRVKQILTNLLSNAVKYNTEAGFVRIVSQRADDDSVEISVTDAGPGMTPEQMSQLFQPFNRLGQERTTLEGTGIGLVISQRLAELMGGSLRARSVTGEGSSFTLALPGVAQADTVRSALIGFESTPAEYHRRVVHYVEDNETNVEVMRGILAQRSQVRMDVSVTGLDSLAAIRVKRPDLILLDMNLPDISGLELLRHLKADPQTGAIPVVVVSADALAKQVETALEAGAAHYLTKPVSVTELLAVLDALLEGIETRFG